MKKRILTGLVLGAITIGFFFLREISTYIFDIFIAITIIMSGMEVSKVFQTSGKYNDTYIVMFFPVLIYLILALSIYFKLPLWSILIITAVLILIVLALCFAIPFFNKKLTRKDMRLLNLPEQMSIKKYSAKKMVNTFYVMLYPMLTLSFLFLLNHLQELNFIGTSSPFAGLDLGLFALILLFTSTIATDTFAYFVGSLIGGKKLCEIISPKKTISGAIGGFVGGVLISMAIFAIFNSVSIYEAAFFATEFALWKFLFYGIFASIISQCGDIFASAIKRKAKVKDFGTIFPGHGGFMDRVDGLSFNAVFTFLFMFLIII